MDKKKTKASAALDIESAKQEISSLLPNPLTKHELQEELELLQKEMEGKTLTKYLESGQLKPMESITFKDITESCITEDMQHILRNIIVQLIDLHAHKLVHGELSSDTVIMSERHFPDESPSNKPIPIRPWRVILATSRIKTEGMKDEKDFKDLSDLIKKILPSNEIPKDVNHLLSKLDDKDHRIDEMFLANHPCTWTSNEVYLYLERMIYKYKNSAGDIKKSTRAKAMKVSVSQDWFDQIENDLLFKKVYDIAKKENSDFQHYPPALQIIFFMLALFNHGFPTESERQETGEEGRWIRKVKGELFCLFPCFLSNFVEQVFDKDVIQAAIGGGDR